MNIIINLAITIVFLVFTISNVGDPKECYISSDDKKVATQFKPSPNAIDYAKRFEYWFIAGVVLSGFNLILYTGSGIGKMKKD